MIKMFGRLGAAVRANDIVGIICDATANPMVFRKLRRVIDSFIAITSFIVRAGTYGSNSYIYITKDICKIAKLADQYHYIFLCLVPLVINLPSEKKVVYISINICYVIYGC